MSREAGRAETRHTSDNRPCALRAWWAPWRRCWHRRRPSTCGASVPFCARPSLLASWLSVGLPCQRPLRARRCRRQRHRPASKPLPRWRWSCPSAQALPCAPSWEPVALRLQGRHACLPRAFRHGRPRPFQSRPETQPPRRLPRWPVWHRGGCAARLWWGAAQARPFPWPCPACRASLREPLLRRRVSQRCVWRPRAQRLAWLHPSPGPRHQERHRQGQQASWHCLWASCCPLERRGPHQRLQLCLWLAGGLCPSSFARPCWSGA